MEGKVIGLDFQSNTQFALLVSPIISFFGDSQVSCTPFHLACHTISLSNIPTLKRKEKKQIVKKLVIVVESSLYLLQFEVDKMENSKSDNDGTKTTDPTTGDENPNNSDSGVGERQQEEGLNMVRQSSTIRTPFTNLSQVDADLALARTLQEQERAYMMLRMGGDGSEYGSWEGGSYIHEDDEDFDDPSGDEYDHTDDGIDDDDQEDDDDDEDDDEDEDAFDVHAHAESGEDLDNNMRVGVELDPASFPNDEAYARALQDAEDREMAARLLALAGINEREDEEEDHVGNSQDTWEEVDPDELSYEELIALGEVVGTESRGLSADTIASLPSLNYKTQNTQDGNDSCVICRLDYEDGDTLTLLSCKHSYHSECIKNWLRINKVCPVCSTEVSTS